MEAIWQPGQSGRVILAMHGTGGGPEDLIPWAKLADPEASILAPAGDVLENGVHRRFFARMPDGRFDLPDLVQRADGFATWLRAQGEDKGFDPAEAAVIGYSNGANMAAAVMLRHERLFRDALLLRTMLPFQPHPEHHLRGRSIVLACGQSDPYLGPEEAPALAELYEALGAKVKLTWHPGGHELGEVDWAAAKTFLD
jgi:predicted esterase